jgi:purine-binding chemotaxis protein CheW
MNRGLRDVSARRLAGLPTSDFVTVIVAGQTFGLPIAAVHDVFIADCVTRVPLAPVEIVGLLNLRGRVVTALCLRRLLRLPPAASVAGCMVVGIEHGGESFGLIVDGVGEVLTLPLVDIQPNPMNLDPRWAIFSKGIYRLDEGLLVIIDIDAALAPQALSVSAAGADGQSRGQAA